MTPPPARLELALTPTPILKLQRLSAHLDAELYVKRDDLTGLLESGHAVRKLEFLVGEALQQGADTLITCGTRESNCCRTVAAVAARLGLRAVLVLKGLEPDVYDGNLLLDHLLGAEVRYLSETEASRVGDALADLASEVRAAGGKPYLIPEGGSNEVGALGYLECAVELAEQIGHGAPTFDTVVVSVRSGCSQAGLLMGKQLVGLPAQIVGVPIGVSAEQARESIALIMDKAVRRFGFAIEVPKRIHLLDGGQTETRADAQEEDLNAIVDLARREGLLLDPVYTGRAFQRLTEALAQDARALGPRVCFIHTGGLFRLFPFRERLSRLVGGRSQARP
jgi:D-cysteine desulfhydrase